MEREHIKIKIQLLPTDLNGRRRELVGLWAHFLLLGSPHSLYRPYYPYRALPAPLHPLHLSAPGFRVGLADLPYHHTHLTSPPLLSLPPLLLCAHTPTTTTSSHGRRNATLCRQGRRCPPPPPCRPPFPSRPYSTAAAAAAAATTAASRIQATLRRQPLTVSLRFRRAAPPHGGGARREGGRPQAPRAPYSHHRA